MITISLPNRVTTLAVFTVLMLLIASVCAAESISLEEYLARVQESHPFFKKEELSKRIALKEQEKHLGDLDWIVSSNPYYVHEESTQDIGFDPHRVDQYGFDIGAEKKFWSTGGTLGLSYDITRSDIESNDLVFGAITVPAETSLFHENGLTLSYSQPLLQDRGGALSRLEYELQGYSVDAAKIIADENKEQFLLNVGDGFLDWVFLVEQIRLLENRYSLAREEHERTIKKHRQNLVDKVDVIRARSAVLNAEQNIMLARANATAKQQELATIAQIDRFDEYVPEHVIYEFSDIKSIDDAIAELHLSSRALDAYELRISQLELQKTGALEQGKPRLDLILSSGIRGGDEEFGDSYGLNRPQYSASIIYRYPIGNRRATAEAIKAEIETAQVREEMSDTRLRLESGLRNIVSNMKELRKVLELNKEQIKIAKEKTIAELRRYNQGRIELTFVIQSRDEEQNVQLLYAQNAITYHKLFLRYKELLDELLGRGDKE